MSKNCDILMRIKEGIEAGEDPERIIPMTLPCELTRDEMIDFLFYIVQVLPDGIRRELARRQLIRLQKEALDESRRD